MYTILQINMHVCIIVLYYYFTLVLFYTFLAELMAYKPEKFTCPIEGIQTCQEPWTFWQEE